MKNISIHLLLLVSLFYITSGCEKNNGPVEYRYEVSGTGGSYDVTLQNVDDNTQQYSNVGNNWYYSWTQTGTRWLYLSAQNQNSSGTVTVRILRNGVVMEENTSSGGYTIATVSGDY